MVLDPQIRSLGEAGTLGGPSSRSWSHEGNIASAAGGAPWNGKGGGNAPASPFYQDLALATLCWQAPGIGAWRRQPTRLHFRGGKRQGVDLSTDRPAAETPLMVTTSDECLLPTGYNVNSAPWNERSFPSQTLINHISCYCLVLVLSPYLCLCFKFICYFLSE